MKKFSVRWSEIHSVIVEAKDEIEAKEKAMDGDIISDESAELESGSLDAIEIKE